MPVRGLSSGPEVGSDSFELSGVRLSEQHGPVWRIERWEQWEPILDQFGSVGDEKLSSVGDDRADSGQAFIVAVGDFQHREAPDSPAVVAFVDGSFEQVIVHCSGAQSHNDEAGWCRFVAERDLLEHCSTVPTIDMRDGLCVMAVLDS